jgi:TPR repeat protein
MMECCSKLICDGYEYANQMRQTKGRLEHSCPFCRQPAPKTEEEFSCDETVLKRVEANDSFAMRHMGSKRYHNKGDYSTAFKYLTKAAGLGDADSHFNQSIIYRKGGGVEKNERKEVYHLEEAAIGGDAFARHNLGCADLNNCRIDRAVKHYIIAATLGNDSHWIP